MKAKSKDKPSREYTCPYCFATVDLDRIHYQCSSPGCAREFASRASSTRSRDAEKYVSADGRNEIDYEKCLIYNKDPRGPDAIVAKNHIIRDSSGTCDICGRPAYIRLCPFCNSQIPPGAEEDGNRIFVILGPKSVGKSHYTAVLINQLKEVVSKEFNCILNPATDETTMKYRDVYYHRLFEEMYKLRPTASYETSVESKEPLIYYLRVFEGERPLVYTFAFFDTAGEDLVTLERMTSLSLNSFIAKASGIVYLVDPLQVPFINRRINMEAKPAVGPDASDILNNICQIIRRNKGLRSGARIDIPIAVTLTKTDVLMKNPENEEEDKVVIGACSSLHIPRENGRYDEENSEQIDAELEEYIRRTMGNNFLQIVSGFKEHRFFAVSALGCNPVSERLPRGVAPFRVEDPFLWLMHIWNDEDQRREKR